MMQAIAASGRACVFDHLWRALSAMERLLRDRQLVLSLLADAAIALKKNQVSHHFAVPSE